MLFIYAYVALRALDRADKIGLILVNSLALYERNIGSYSTARSLLEKIKETHSNLLVNDANIMEIITNNLAAVLCHQGLYSESQELYEGF